MVEFLRWTSLTAAGLALLAVAVLADADTSFATCHDANDGPFVLVIDRTFNTDKNTDLVITGMDMRNGYIRLGPSTMCDPLLMIEERPTNGTLVKVGNYGLTYTPNRDFVGTDSFSISVSVATDFGTTATDSATYTVNVLETGPVPRDIEITIPDGAFEPYTHTFTNMHVSDPDDSLDDLSIGIGFPDPLILTITDGVTGRTPAESGTLDKRKIVTFLGLFDHTYLGNTTIYQYTVFDPDRSSSLAYLHVTVAPIETPRLSVNDITISVIRGETARIPVSYLEREMVKLYTLPDWPFRQALDTSQPSNEVDVAASSVTESGIAYVELTPREGASTASFDLRFDATITVPGLNDFSLSDAGTVTINVLEELPPTARDIEITIPDGAFQPYTYSFTGMDVGVPDYLLDRLTIELGSPSPHILDITGGITGPTPAASGTLDEKKAVTFIGIHDQTYMGATTRYPYTVTDTDGNSDSAYLVVTVEPITSPKFVVNDHTFDIPAGGNETPILSKHIQGNMTRSYAIPDHPPTITTDLLGDTLVNVASVKFALDDGPGFGVGDTLLTLDPGVGTASFDIRFTATFGDQKDGIKITDTGTVNINVVPRDIDITIPDGAFKEYSYTFTDMDIGDLADPLFKQTVELASADSHILDIVGGITGATPARLGVLDDKQTVTFLGIFDHTYLGNATTYDYVVTDPDGNSESARLSVTVEPIETPRIFVSDHTYSAIEGETTRIPISEIHRDTVDLYVLPGWPVQDDFFTFPPFNPVNLVLDDMGRGAIKTDDDEYIEFTTELGASTASFGIGFIEFVHVGRDTLRPQDTATITIDVIERVCSIDATPSLDFGRLYHTQTSNQTILSIQNTGDVPSTIDISGTDWLSEDGRSIMDVSSTRYSASPGTDYPAMTALQDTPSGAFQTDPGDVTDIHMRVRLSLDEPSFLGGIRQTITVTNACN